MLRDYQRIMVDSIMLDIFETYGENSNDDMFQAKLESRIEAYDQERNEQLERDLPAAIARAVEDVC